MCSVDPSKSDCVCSVEVKESNDPIKSDCVCWVEEIESTDPSEISYVCAGEVTTPTENSCMCAGASSCNSVSSCERNMQNGHVEVPIVKPLSQGTPSSEPTRSVHVTEPHDTLSSSADSSVSSCKVAPDDTFECDCFRKASQEIRELQKVDSDLVPYFQ